jgi:hypothetical protein
MREQKRADHKANLDGTDYRSGIGVVEVEGDTDNEDEAGEQGAKKKRKTNGKKTKDKTKDSTHQAVCKSCGKEGHSRKSHRDCDRNPINIESNRTDENEISGGPVVGQLVQQGD